MNTQAWPATILALARRHVTEGQQTGGSIGGAAASRVPRLLSAAVEARPRLGDAFKRTCLDGQWLRARACTLPHLLDVAEPGSSAR